MCGIQESRFQGGKGRREVEMIVRALVGGSSDFGMEDFTGCLISQTPASKPPRETGWPSQFVVLSEFCPLRSPKRRPRTAHRSILKYPAVFTGRLTPYTALYHLRVLDPKV